VSASQIVLVLVVVLVLEWVGGCGGGEVGSLRWGNNNEWDSWDLCDLCDLCNFSLLPSFTPQHLFEDEDDDEDENDLQ
jgi:hypothetical protein